MKEQYAISTEEITYTDKSMTRFSDGSYTNSKILCPTKITCIIKTTIRSIN